MANKFPPTKGKVPPKGKKPVDPNEPDADDKKLKGKKPPFPPAKGKKPPFPPAKGKKPPVKGK